MIYLVVGFIGAFLMFCGDMLLYYDPDDFNYKAGDSTETKMNAIKEVMGKVSPKRLFAGGFIGPVAASFIVWDFTILSLSAMRMLKAWQSQHSCFPASE